MYTYQDGTILKSIWHNNIEVGYEEKVNGDEIKVIKHAKKNQEIKKVLKFQVESVDKDTAQEVRV